MSKDKEIRQLQATEVRTDSNESDKMIIEGYALKFDTWSQDLGGFVETIDRRALDNADMSDVMALIDHDTSKILARTTGESLTLKIDDTGLWFRCQLPNTTYAKDLYENIRVGNINQCSFGFQIADKGDEIRYDKSESIYKRTIKSFKRIMDVTITGNPAYKDTDAALALRSIKAIEQQQKQQEQRSKELELLKLQMDLLKTTYK